MSVAGSAPAAEAPGAPEPEAGRKGGYGRGAKILSVGIATTGLVTFAYFSVASYVLESPSPATLPDIQYVAQQLLELGVIKKPVTASEHVRALGEKRL